MVLKRALARCASSLSLSISLSIFLSLSLLVTLSLLDTLSAGAGEAGMRGRSRWAGGNLRAIAPVPWC